MSATFSCSACGRQYPWKPELAGRSAKCKCGQVLNVPAKVPAEPEPESDLLDFADDPIPAEPVKAKPLAAKPKAAAAASTAPAAQRCPSCQSDMAPGAPICIGCGFDLRTGKHVQTEIDADSPAAVPGKKKPAKSGAVPKGKTRKEVEKESLAAAERSKGIKQMVLIGVGALLVIGLFFAANKFFKKSDDATGSGGAPALGDDAKVLQMFKDEEEMEGIAFVDSHSSRTLSASWTNSKSRKEIEKWYGLGAAKVWAFNAQISQHAILELPADPAKRAVLFDWAGNFYETQQKPRPKDVGQKYIILRTN